MFYQSFQSEISYWGLFLAFYKLNQFQYWQTVSVYTSRVLFNWYQMFVKRKDEIQFWRISFQIYQVESWESAFGHSVKTTLFWSVCCAMFGFCKYFTDNLWWLFYSKSYYLVSTLMKEPTKDNPVGSLTWILPCSWTSTCLFTSPLKTLAACFYALWDFLYMSPSPCLHASLNLLITVETSLHFTTYNVHF